MDKTDEELVADYRAGDRSAFNALVERHLSGIYTYVARFVGSNEEAEDISQETFIKIWRAINAYEPASSKFKTWMLRIARNTAIDFLRKKKHIPFSEFEHDGVNVLTETMADEKESVEVLLARAEDTKAVTDALEKLGRHHREILVLYYTNKITFEEIGELLNESANTVKSRHRRALKALAVILSPTKAPNQPDAPYI